MLDGLVESDQAADIRAGRQVAFGNGPAEPLRLHPA
jgi:hypothetical protein